MIQQDVRFKNLEKKIGLFALLALAGVALVFLFIGIEKDLFTKKYTLRFTVEKGTGFSRGMPVKLSGFHVGRIAEIALNEKAMVDIKIKIDKKYQKWIHRDSVASLKKEGLVGDAIIEISVGTMGSVVLKDGDTIAYEKTKGLEEVANDIADKVKPVLIEVRDIINYVNDPDGDIKQSLKNFRTVTARLDGTRRLADNLLIKTGKDLHGVTDTAVALLDNANDKISRLQPPLENVDATMARLPPLLDKVTTTLENVEKTSVELRTVAEKALPRLPPLVRRAEEVLQGADTTLNAVQDIWPIKNHVPKANEKALIPSDSHD